MEQQSDKEENNKRRMKGANMRRKLLTCKPIWFEMTEAWSCYRGTAKSKEDNKKHIGRESVDEKFYRKGQQLY